MNKILLAGIVSFIVASNIYASAPKKKVAVAANHNNEYVVQQKVVEFVNSFPVSSYQYSSQNQVLVPAYQYSVGEQRQEPNLDIEALITRVSEATADRVVRRLVESGYLGNKPVAPVAPVTPEKPVEPTPEPAPEPLPAPEPVPVPQPEPPVANNEILTLFTQSCKGCHTGPNPDGVLSILVEENGRTVVNPNLTQLERWSIFDRIDGQGLPREKVMPRNAEPLPDEDVELIREWVRKKGEE